MIQNERRHDLDREQVALLRASFACVTEAEERARIVTFRKSRGGRTNHDVRKQPAYSVSEAARHLRLSTATLRSWVAGRGYTTRLGTRRSEPLLQPALREPTTLSFWNLIEAHVLRALRTEHGVSAPDLRTAIHYAESQLGIANLLLRRDLQTEGGRVLLNRYGELIDLSRSGQIAMRQVLDAHLKRVEWDETNFPIRLYPFVSADDAVGDPVVAIDPRIAFGRPMVRPAGVSTRVIVDRLDAGESISEIATDYGLNERLIEQAVLYERAS